MLTLSGAAATAGVCDPAGSLEECKLVFRMGMILPCDVRAGQCLVPLLLPEGNSFDQTTEKKTRKRKTSGRRWAR